MIGWKTIGNFLSQWYHIKWWVNFVQKHRKKFSWMGKNGFKKDFLALQFLHTNFSCLYLFIKLVITQFFLFFLELIGTCEFYWKRVNFSFLKNSLVHINSKLNEKNCMIIYTVEPPFATTSRKQPTLISTHFSKIQKVFELNYY